MTTFYSKIFPLRVRRVRAAGMFSFAMFAFCAGVFAEESALTRLICGKEEGVSYDRRVRAVQVLGRSLAADDFFALQSFLEKKPSEDAASEDQLNAIKNDVAAKLLGSEHLPDGFSRRFLAMVSAPEAGLVYVSYTIYVPYALNNICCKLLIFWIIGNILTGNAIYKSFNEVGP